MTEQELHKLSMEIVNLVYDIDVHLDKAIHELEKLSGTSEELINETSIRDLNEARE